MTDAFYCDFCEDFHRGEPDEELFVKRHHDRQGTDVVKVADLCDECAGPIVDDP